MRFRFRQGFSKDSWSPCFGKMELCGIAVVALSDDVGIGEDIVQCLFLDCESGHDVTDHENQTGQRFCKVAARRACERNRLALVIQLLADRAPFSRACRAKRNSP